jgi:hypothetical protein
MTTTTPDAAATTQVYQLYIRADQERVWDAITSPAVVSKFLTGLRSREPGHLGDRAPARRILEADADPRQAGRLTEDGRECQGMVLHPQQPQDRARDRAATPAAGDVAARARVRAHMSRLGTSTCRVVPQASGSEGSADYDQDWTLPVWVGELPI